MNSHQADRNLFLAIGCLTISALLFSVMGICIRYASHSVDNYTIVFFRNVVGLILFLPFIFKQGMGFVKTEKLWKDILYQVLLTLPRNSTSSLPNHLRVWTSILKQDYALWSAMFRTGTHWSALIWIYLRLWEESEPSPIHLEIK